MQYQGIPVVSAVDTTNNITIADVIGNKSDTVAGNSIWAMAEVICDHIHSASKVYPTLANGVTVTGGAAWTLGNFAEIVPANAIASVFDIHYLNISSASAADTYELVLYAATVEIGRVRFTKAATATDVPLVPFMCAKLPANTQIQAKVASASGSDNVVVSVFYHIY